MDIYTKVVLINLAVFLTVIGFERVASSGGSSFISDRWAGVYVFSTTLSILAWVIYKIAIW